RVFRRDAKRREEFAHGGATDAQLLSSVLLWTTRRSGEDLAEHDCVVIDKAISDVIRAVHPDGALIRHTTVASQMPHELCERIAPAIGQFARERGSATRPGGHLRRDRDR